MNSFIPLCGLKFERLVTQITGDVYFIQVGANDGVSFDDLYETVKKKQWGGLVIEPLPNYFKKLRENYRNLKKVIPVNVALASSDGETIMYTVRNTETCPPDMRGISSFSINHVLKHFRTRPRVMKRFPKCVEKGNVVKESIKTLSWNSLVRNFTVPDCYHLLQIDAEGFDFEVLKFATAASAPTPFIIKWEQLHLSHSDCVGAHKHLESLGYVSYCQKCGTRKCMDAFAVRSTSAPPSCQSLFHSLQKFASGRAML